MNLTHEQAAIVEDVNRDVVVTAGAGTGKTRVLVERYLALLRSHRIGDIAAVTFTDAAAAEMRERVRRDVLSKEDLARHREELDRAVIGTIHSLCLQVLREHPVEAGMDPAAVVLSEDEAEIELLRACAETLESLPQQGQGLLSLREMGVYEVRTSLPKMVRRRDEVQSGFRGMPGNSPDRWEAGIRSLMDEEARSVVDAARPQLAESVVFLGIAHAAAGSDALTPRVAAVLDILQDPASSPWKDLLDGVMKAGAEIKLTGGSKRNWGEDLAEVKNVLRHIRDLAGDFEKLPQWNDHDELALNVLVDLHTLFTDACFRYQACKDRLGGLDYLDLEIKARELLDTHPHIAQIHRRRFKHLMVDELQDTNPAQIELLQLLLGRGGPKAFFVGDAKQAIYRFRGGDVRTFRRLHRRVAKSGGLHRLSQTFRSHDDLVEGLNGLFAHVLADAREDYEAPMEEMRGAGRQAPSRPSMVLMQVSDKTPDDESAREYEKRRVEADVVAAEVQRLLESKALVWDPDKRETRTIASSDIAILLRRLSNLHLFEQALENRDVRYRTMSGAGFFRRQEVVDIANLVRWLAAPDDAIALVGILRSPMFMLDDQTLLLLRSGSRDRDLLELLEGPPDHVDAQAREFCLNAFRVLTRLQKEAPFDAAHSLVEKALALTGFEASWGPLPGGEQSLANIRKFVGILRGLQGQSLDEVAAFLRRRFEDTSIREAQAPLDELDAVRLITVHGAKGLEFPVVFVPECDSARNPRYDYVQWRREEGISVTLTVDVDEDTRRRRPGFYSFLVNRHEAEDEAEYKRLFYVAATRAADKLYLSGAVSGRTGTWMSMAQEAIDEGVWTGVEVRPAVPADIDSVARRQKPPVVSPPPESVEQEITSPFVPRPPVVPVRSSTPVTALERSEKSFRPAYFGPGLGLVRGRLAHRAIEQWFTTKQRPDLAGMVRGMDDSLSREDVARLSAEVNAMLDWLDRSPLAMTLRREDTVSHFEMPFSWNWEEMPVHGTIDLVYRNSRSWHVVDFKTDDVRGRPVEQVAERYLPQLALYREALKQATGETPRASLVFLRTGTVYTPPERSLTLALAEVRKAVDRGWEVGAPAEPADIPDQES